MKFNRTPPPTPNLPAFILMPALMLFVCALPLKAQWAPMETDDGLRIGAGVNWGTLYFERDNPFPEDYFQYEPGFQAHVSYAFHLRGNLSASAGVGVLHHRTSLRSFSQQMTDSAGQPIEGNVIITEPRGAIATSYINIPLHLKFRTVSANGAIYLNGGPELNLKSAHQNTTFDVVMLEDGDVVENGIEPQLFDMPERSNVMILAFRLAVGYSFPETLLPLNIEVSGMNGITPYIGGDNNIRTWMRGLSMSLIWRF